MEAFKRKPNGNLELAYDVVSERTGAVLGTGLSLSEARKLADQDQYDRRVMWRKPV
jgi:hypothetical protein